MGLIRPALLDRPVLTFQRLFLLSPELRDATGHQREYVSLLHATATGRGLESRIVTPPGGHRVMPDMAVDERLPILQAPGPANGFIARARRKTSSAVQARQRLLAYRNLFADSRPHDLNFLHTASFPEMGIVLKAWPGKTAGHLAVTLRSDHDDNPARKVQIRKALAGATKSGVTLMADTLELVQALGPLAPRTVHEIPPPWSGSTPDTARVPGRIGVFGARRRHKGYLKLPGLIQAARRHDPDLSFVVHGYPHRELRDDPELGRTGQTLRDLGAEVIEEVLSSEAMQAQVAACAAVLLPYDKNVYRYGSSGMFVLAVASGCGVVVPAGTWMEAEARREDLSRVHATDIDDAEATAHALSRAAAIGSATFVASKAEAAWTDRHTPLGLLERLLDVAARD